MNNYGAKRGEKTWISLKTSDLCKLFGVSKYTLSRWIRLGYLNPYSLEDIIDKFNNPAQLDKRKKAASQEK